ncbi:hypothetical protein OJ996_22940 [Luteolibacter sp. GHJ8]|uniref:Secreted protein n=1 Tax=Luteolibacter rhizosphaerae TaxID=2989719 RepID=A0ABT3G9D5_9BACT|nr:hypothetical protein [Luteolibacter rhizosphaerae]MCW1916462.1 hypothetical protein [Luteolibacter rhizosphaerae]
MKLALHRSIIFWSGILVMAFICWAWRDSQQAVTLATIGSPSAFHGHSGILFRETHSDEAGVWRYPATSFYDNPVTPDPFPPPFTFTTEFDALDRKVEMINTLPELLLDRAIPIRIAAEYWAPEGIHNNLTLFIPHWLLLLSFALPWSALLFWRARRRKRGALRGA